MIIFTNSTNQNSIDSLAAIFKKDTFGQNRNSLKQHKQHQQLFIDNIKFLYQTYLSSPQILNS